MAVSLIPIGPGVPQPVAAVLKSLYDAVAELQQPQAPIPLPHVALKTDLTRFAASDFKECGIICDEINSVAVSTPTAGVYAWTRADGSAL